MKKIINHLLQQINLGQFIEWIDFLVNITEIIFIAFIAWLVTVIVRKIIVLIEKRMIKSSSVEDKKRVHTLARVLTYISSIIILAIAIISMLDELGISVAPLLATAGVAGIAIGFGAQSLVKDYFTGFVMLIENQIRQDDIVEIADKTGTVEEVTLRYVRLRDYEGAVHYIPNSSITVVTNRTRTYAYAVSDISVAYKEDLSHVYEVMNQVAKNMRESTELKDKILADLEIAGVETLGQSSIVIRCRLKVIAQYQSPIRRLLQEKIKNAFDLNKIEIPYQHLVIKNPN